MLSLGVVDGLPEDEETVRFLAEKGLDKVGDVGDVGIKLLDWLATSLFLCGEQPGL